MDISALKKSSILMGMILLEMKTHNIDSIDNFDEKGYVVYWQGELF